MKLLHTILVCLVCYGTMHAQDTHMSVQLKNGFYSIPTKTNISNFLNSSRLYQDVFQVHFKNLQSKDAFLANFKPISSINNKVSNFRFTKNDLLKLENNNNIVIFKIPAEFKIEKALLDIPLQETRKLQILLFENFKLEDLKNVFPNIQLSYDQSGDFINVEVTMQQAFALANLGFVHYINEQPQLQSFNFDHNSLSNTIEATTSLNNGGFGLSGNGISVLVGDVGAPSHIDLPTNLSLLVGLNPHYHTTHVVSTICGRGLLNSMGQGIAKGSKLFVTAGTLAYSGIENNVNVNNVSVTNNSYGLVSNVCDKFGAYDNNSLSADFYALLKKEVVHVFAAGNSGAVVCSGGYSGGYNSIVNGPQCSKNVITVGNTTKTEGFDLYFASAKGPTDDGRLKPELVSTGSAVLGCNELGGYSSLTGTSMSAPVVTAGVALMQEAYKARFNGSLPTSDCIKAILCNTADDLGSEGPNFNVGYGQVNISKACKYVKEGNFYSGSIVLDNVQTFQVSVPANAVKFVATLAWLDPVPDLLSSITLVNDLDIEVIAPDGTYLPWTLNPSIGTVTNAALRGRDSLNNLEQVSILNPILGTYTIRVIGHGVATSQNFSLVARVEEKQLKVTFPFKKVKINSSSYPIIRWENTTGDAGTTKVEYSSNNGQTWVVIGTKANGENSHVWFGPTIITKSARIRITTSGHTAVSDSFTIGQVPTNLTVANKCSGSITLKWTGNALASSYNIYKFNNESNQFSLVKQVDTTTAILLDISLTQKEIFAISAVSSTGIETGLSKGISESPGTEICNFPIQSILELKNTKIKGRINSSTALSANEEIKLNIKNIGFNPIINRKIYYQINNLDPVKQALPQVILENGVLDFSFDVKADFLIPGEYLVRLGWCDINDTPILENSIEVKFTQLKNPALIFSASSDYAYKIDFESLDSQVFSDDMMGIDDLENIDFKKLNSSAIAIIGSQDNYLINNQKSLVLGSSQSENSASETTFTFNLSNYDIDSSIFLNFWIQALGTLSNEEKIYIRGNDQAQWIEALQLNSIVSSLLDKKEIVEINLSQLLNANSQEFSSSFQIKFYQASSSMANPQLLSDGYAIDDIKIHLAGNDLKITNISYPTKQNYNLSINENILVNVSNNINQVVDGFSFYYQINNGMVHGPIVVEENQLGPFEQKVFSIPSSHLTFLGEFKLNVWINQESDLYSHNDSIRNYNFENIALLDNFPFLDGFETENSFWLAKGEASSWAKGTPTKTKMHKTANGTASWATGLNSLSRDVEQSSLYSPAFDLSNISNPKLSFSFFQDIQNFDEKAWVEYSEDGINWFNLLNVADQYNWYSGSEGWDNEKSFWHVATCRIPVELMTNLSHVRFRINYVCELNTTSEGIGVDDFHIYNSREIFDGENESTSNNVNPTDWNEFLSTSGAKIVDVKPNNSQNLGQTTVIMSKYTSTPPRHNSEQYFLDRNVAILPENNLTSGTATIRIYYLDSEIEALRNAPPDFDAPEDAYELGITKVSSENSDTILGNEISPIITYFSFENTNMIPYENGYYLELEVDGFSEFYASSGGENNNSPLPLKLEQFNVSKISQAEAKIKFSINQIDQIKSISLEYASDKNIDSYIKIQSFNVKNIKYLTKDVVHDISDKSGKLYYRLVFEQLDGKQSYSKVISIENESITNLEIYPSIVKENVRVEIQNMIKNVPFKIQVIGQNGHLVQNIQSTSNNERWSQNIDPNFAAGVYFIRFEQNNTILLKKIIKI